ncbi:MAG: hypothetical protein KF729_25280 [Sandaracinaceae bacterium]|nr:hypothetical protein [Sandaracinaceae bacterium]
MSATDLQAVKEELVKAGLEIYRTRPAELEIAERVRLHIMDSGIRVRDGLRVVFTARTQRSDFGASVSPDQLFERVRAAVGQRALDRGYVEEAALTVEVKDPMDEAKVLDTWHEIVYGKAAGDLNAVVEEVRWALSVDKFIAP